MDRARGFKFALPLAVVVAVSSLMMLNGQYEEVPMENRVLITIGATVIAFIVAFILFCLKDKSND
ncbi:MAG: acyltransferase [Kurthia sp.]